ncbi:hypothetical protein IFM89_033077 [Coptis chinensis]|uniref:Molybdate transporter 1 n=1 Tax=Coptis chinensis TaxID=261450 RepID=A0A835IID8_9MAGN|nr:hypothetical protein IFM89_033077 [Coptis chinensis]
MEPSSQTQTTTPLLQRRWSNLPFRTSFQMKTNVWSELGGSVGDLGTYIPIVLALSIVNHLDLGTTLIFTSFYNIITGFLFGVPMPVQPMKSIAAVAISESQTHLTVPQIMAAGICTATVLLVLGVTGLMSVIYKYIPLPVVRGVQLSQGLQFAFSAIKYIRYDQNFATGKSGASRSWIGLDGLIVALSALLFIVLVTGSGDDGIESLTESEELDQRRRRRGRRMRILSAIPAAFLFVNCLLIFSPKKMYRRQQFQLVLE